MKSNVDGPSPATIMEQGLRSIASVQAYNLENKVGDDYEAALLHDAVDNFSSGMVAGFVYLWLLAVRNILIIRRHLFRGK
jgi:hypothetical protein